MTLPLPTHPLVDVTGDPDDYPDDLTRAARDELESLWDDLYAARRHGINTGWSIQCHQLAYRIVRLSRLVGPTLWEAIQIDLLYDGVYERVHQDAGIDYPSIDWQRVDAVKARIEARRT
jgi:hypothetical protein